MGSTQIDVAGDLVRSPRCYGRWSPPCWRGVPHPFFFVKHYSINGKAMPRPSSRLITAQKRRRDDAGQEKEEETRTVAMLTAEIVDDGKKPREELLSVMTFF